MKLLVLASSVVLLASCSSTPEPVPNPSIPEVFESAQFSVISDTGIVYAEGLAHQSSGSANATAVALKLDVYTPDNAETNRPMYLFFHGGGFVGGSRSASTITYLADYYTSRGWVFASASYRLQASYGTIPDEWESYTNFLVPALVNQYRAIYPALRDAKSALRFLVANSDNYGFNPEYITVGGSSAGAVTAIAISTSNPEDFRDEIPLADDPTLTTIHASTEFEVQTIIDLWGSGVGCNILEILDGESRFDSDDPPLFVMHGTEDPTVLFSEAERLKATYDSLSIPIVYYPIQGAGHGTWNATVGGKRLEELAFDFIVDQQNLVVQ